MTLPEDAEPSRAPPPADRDPPPARSRRTRGFVGLLCLILLGSLLAVFLWRPDGTAEAPRPQAAPDEEAGHLAARRLADQLPLPTGQGGYATSTACRDCHPQQFETWHASYHRTMTQAAVPEAVLGDFDDVTLEQEMYVDGPEGGWTVPVEFRLQRRGDEFWVTVTPHDAWAANVTENAYDVQIVMTTGSHHYQIYWTSEGPDRMLTAFPFAYLRDEGRWIPREAALVMPPSARQQAVRWNEICIRCHSTHGQPRWNEATRRADSRVAELGIACEACHGPAEKHVEAQRAAQQGTRAAPSDAAIVNPATLAAQRSAQVCGGCHAIATFPERDYVAGHWNRFRPGQDLHQHRHVIRPLREETLSELQPRLAQDPDYLLGRYWSDGMVRVSGREYNALLETPCYRGGEFSCLNCHTMHHDPPDDSWRDDQLADGMRGDRACLECHEELGRDISAHTHHAADSSGSRCYNCHMPRTTYGLLKAIRSHQIDVPRVAATLDAGRPTACNICHADKTLAWTQDHLADWYGAEQSPLDASRRQVAASLLDLLSGDAGNRALAAANLGWEPARRASGEDWMAPHLAQLLVDPYAAVRYIAYRSLRRLPGFADFPYDYLGPPGQRARARQRALEIWHARDPEQRGSRGTALLIREDDGRLDAAAVQKLLEQRDDRDVDLQE